MQLRPAQRAEFYRLVEFPIASGTTDPHGSHDTKNGFYIISILLNILIENVKKMVKSGSRFQVLGSREM